MSEGMSVSPIDTRWIAPWPITRRRFMGGLSAAGAAWAVTRGASAEARASSAVEADRVAVVDVNVNLFRWPFRRLPLDESASLIERMDVLGIESAWAASFEALLHRDTEGVNQRLVEECAKWPGRLVPFGTVNLSLPDWREDLRRCQEVHRMPGIRLLPNYHGYTLGQPEFAELIKAAAARGVLVQIVVTMEDARTQHPLVRVADVDLRPLPDLLKTIRASRVVILNAGRSVPAAVMKALAAADGVYFDIARVESTRGVASFLSSLPAGRGLFGTHAPFLHPEATMIKVAESSLADDVALGLLKDNARGLLRG